MKLLYVSDAITFTKTTTENNCQLNNFNLKNVNTALQSAQEKEDPFPSVDINILDKLFENFKTNISNNLVLFLSEVMSNSTIQMKMLTLLTENIKKFIVGVMSQELKVMLKEVLQGKTFEMFEKILEFCGDPFKNIETEHKFLKNLSKMGIYSPPEKFNINIEQIICVRKGKTAIAEEKVEGILMPLSFQIQNFFEKPNLLKATIKRTKWLENSVSNNLTNFAQGDLWREKIKDKNTQINIPFCLYNDDMETGDPLSGHSGSQSVSNFFYTFPTLPAGLSNLENIFISMILKSKDVKEFGYEKCLHRLVHEIIKLEQEGIDFIIDEKQIRVFFCVRLNHW